MASSRTCAIASGRSVADPSRSLQSTPMVKPHFRAGVVAVVQRGDGMVLAFERTDLTGEWQLPQGGIEAGESPQQAAWRELREETGLTKRDVRLVREHASWTVYEWPAPVRDSPRLGQAHRWFFFEPIVEPITPQPDGREFAAWRWMTTDELITCVVDFRKVPYVQVFGAGADFGVDVAADVGVIGGG